MSIYSQNAQIRNELFIYSQQQLRTLKGLDIFLDKVIDRTQLQTGNWFWGRKTLADESLRDERQPTMIGTSEYYISAQPKLSYMFSSENNFYHFEGISSGFYHLAPKLHEHQVESEFSVENVKSGFFYELQFPDLNNMYDRVDYLTRVMNVDFSAIIKQVILENLPRVFRLVFLKDILVTRQEMYIGELPMFMNNREDQLSDLEYCWFNKNKTDFIELFKKNTALYYWLKVFSNNYGYMLNTELRQPKIENIKFFLSTPSNNDFILRNLPEECQELFFNEVKPGTVIIGLATTDEEDTVKQSLFKVNGFGTYGLKANYIPYHYHNTLCKIPEMSLLVFPRKEDNVLSSGLLPDKIINNSSFFLKELLLNLGRIFYYGTGVYDAGMFDTWRKAQRQIYWFDTQVYKTRELNPFKRNAMQEIDKYILNIRNLMRWMNNEIQLDSYLPTIDSMNFAVLI